MKIFDISPKDLSAILSESSTFRRIFIEYTASLTGPITVTAETDINNGDFRQLRIDSLRDDIMGFAYENKSSQLRIMEYLRDTYSCSDLREVFPDQIIENYITTPDEVCMESLHKLVNYILTLV